MTNSPHERAVLRAVAEAIRSHVRRAFDVLSGRVQEIADDVRNLREEVATQPKSVVTAQDVFPELKKHIDEVLENLPRPKDGASVTVEDVAPVVEATVNRYLLGIDRHVTADMQRAIDAALQRIPKPLDGKDADPSDVAARLVDDVSARVLATVSEKVASLAPADPSMEQVERAVQHYMVANPIVVPVGKDGSNGADGRDGINGKDADPQVTAALIIDQLDLKASSRANVTKLCQDLVDAAVARLPVPKDAPPVSGEMIAAAVKHYMADNPLPIPKDGAPGQSVDIADVDRLVEQRVEQRAALWGLDFERRAQGILQNAIDRMPVPRDGKDGKDGFTAKDFAVQDAGDGRTLRFVFKTAEGEQVFEHRMRVPMYKEVWKEGSVYEIDDMVTYAGSLWIALKDTNTRPGTADWRLCVKSPRGPRSNG
jgi:hypothetical protein